MSHLRYEDMAKGQVKLIRAKIRGGVRRRPFGCPTLHRKPAGGLRLSRALQLVVDVLLKRDMPELGDHSIQYPIPPAPAIYVRGPSIGADGRVTVPTR